MPGARGILFYLIWFSFFNSSNTPSMTEVIALNTCDTVKFFFVHNTFILVIACMVWDRRRHDYNTGICVGACLCPSSVNISKDPLCLITLGSLSALNPEAFSKKWPSYVVHARIHSPQDDPDFLSAFCYAVNTLPKFMREGLRVTGARGNALKHQQYIITNNNKPEQWTSVRACEMWYFIVL